MRFYPEGDINFYLEYGLTCMKRKPGDWKSRKYTRLIYLSWGDLDGSKMEKITPDLVKPPNWNCKNRRKGAFLRTDRFKLSDLPEPPDICNVPKIKQRERKVREKTNKRAGCHTGIPPMLPDFDCGIRVAYKDCKVGTGLTPPLRCTKPCPPCPCCIPCKPCPIC